nr:MULTISPECIES: glycerol-3-phosphate responsive antiterminator [Bacillus]
MKNQTIIPAIRNIKEFNQFLQSNYQVGIFMDFHIAQMKSLYEVARQHEKKMILHVDKVNGIKADEYGTEFICQEFKPYGIISTKSNVIMKAKQKGVISIQRIFLIDGSSIEKNIKLFQKTDPDFIEILPGVIPKAIESIRMRANKEVLTGGLIETREEVRSAIVAGATAVTTSKQELWLEKPTSK